MDRSHFHFAIPALLVWSQFAFAHESSGAAAPATSPPAAQVRNSAIQFESTSDPFFTVQSRFTGNAVVTSNAIEVRIDSGILSFAARGKEGDWRNIEEYYVSLATGVEKAWRFVSDSRPVAVERDLVFGKDVTLSPTNLVIPLKNISARSNYWLTFTTRQVSEKNPEAGYAHSHTRRDLFTNLVPTTTRMPLWSDVGPASRTSRFVQRHWTNFPMVNFLKPTNGNETVFQHFPVNEHVVGEFQGRHYSGVRFTAPAWMDGDFEFAFVHLYGSAQELRSRPGYAWGLAKEEGEFRGLGDVERVMFKDHPETRARYPFTEKGYTGRAGRNHFVPGQTYVLWWAHYWNGKEGVAPDLALALAIVSDRGRKEHGAIAWR
jgi:hypothetical protein